MKGNKIKKAIFANVSLLLSVIILCTASMPALATEVADDPQNVSAVYASRIIADNKTVYDEHLEIAQKLEKCFRNRSIELTLRTRDVDSKEISKITREIVSRNPELFYVNINKILCICTGTRLDVVMPNYLYSESEIASKSVELDNAIRKYLGYVNSNMSEIDKALILHDKLIADCEYNESAVTVYDALVKGEASTAAFAMAYSALLARAGIYSEIVFSADMYRYWNKIKINGSYYNVDVAYDASRDVRYGRVSHKYFMLSDSAFKSTDNYRKAHIGFDDAYYKAASTKYDKSRLGTFDNPLCYIDGKFYTIDNNSTSAYDRCLITYVPATDTAKLVKKLNETWFVGEGTYFNGGFMGIGNVGNVLYYNTTNCIMQYNVSNNTSQVYYKDNTLKNYSNYYGMKIENGAIYANISKTPNESGTEKYIAKVTVNNRAIGDANMDNRLDISDATIIQKYIVGLISSKDIDLIAADYNGDGAVDVDDATAIQWLLFS